MFETQISSDTRHRNILIAIVLTVCIGVGGGILFLWSYLLSSSSDERFVPRSFDSAQWKEAPARSPTPAIRIRMIDDLLSAHKLEGKSRAEIVSLLGEPDDNPGLLEWDMVYCLGPERSWISMDAEWLVLRLNEQQQVTEYKVITT